MACMFFNGKNIIHSIYCYLLVSYQAESGTKLVFNQYLLNELMNFKAWRPLCTGKKPTMTTSWGLSLFLLALLVLTPSSPSILSGGRSDDWETWSSICHVHSCQAQQYIWLCLKYIHVLLQTHNDVSGIVCEHAFEIFEITSILM